MTVDEKLTAFRDAISPEVEQDAVLSSLLEDAQALILNRAYPFGYDEGTVVPKRYERIQISLAVELYSKRGAEGQTSHSENGISRSWAETSPLLRQIIPHCGSVSTDA